MSQSNVIFAFVGLAFLVFITMKGELPIYMGFLLSDPKGAAAAPGNQGVSLGTAIKIGTMIANPAAGAATLAMP